MDNRMPTNGSPQSGDRLAPFSPSEARATDGHRMANAADAQNNVLLALAGTQRAKDGRKPPAARATKQERFNPRDAYANVMKLPIRPARQRESPANPMQDAPRPTRRQDYQQGIYVGKNTPDRRPLVSAWKIPRRVP